ncbi:tetratricopeptide repeat protein [Nonlabens ulvanivorans]|uniref:type IX secretion system periplasmic lipoprotein PorW/SprE n=1 Tax=Nonlabens ulvanivorans TaxID=906888 RepID=UPI0032679201
MRTTLINILTFLLLLVIVTSCSRKKNSFVSRNLHAVGTEYNVLYNGDLALQAGLDELEATYNEDYWDILPVERMQLKQEVFLPGQKPANPNFERAEEKAVKAVQKHSIFVNEEEFNPQVDDAYLLLGKARYYDQRFVPALEAFNYILQFMPESDQLNQAKIWRERTNMRLENNETAIINLTKLLKEESEIIENEDLANANATLSQAFLNLEQIDSALIYMNRAANLTKNKETIARYKFIAGQLFAKAGERDSAFVKFDQIIEMHRKVPRRYYVHSFIEKIKLFDNSTDSEVLLLETLNDLEENRENRPWLDHIYSRKAIYFENRDSLNDAVTYYNLSLRAKGGTDQYLRGNNYSALGKISFNQNKYAAAGKYYDSAMVSYVERSPEHRLVKKKRDNLEDVILYEERRRSADSIFNVLDMSTDQQIAYYNEYIAKLKAEEERLAKLAEVEALKEAQNQNAFQTIQNNKTTKRGNAGPAFGPIGGAPSTPTLSGSPTFYFYNPQTVARGKQDFRRKWGKRKLENNWRRKNKKDDGGGEIVIEEDEALVEEEVRPEFTPEFYIDQLPEGMSVLDSIASARNFAYYQLGVIYKEKFKRNDLAISRLENLITFEPAEKLLLPGLYNLYLIYNESGAFAKADIYKSRIINEFPDTRYAQILLNPDAKIEDNASPSAVYKRLYKEYEKGNYEIVVTNVERYVTLFNGDPIVPRLELLKAFAAGRLYGFKEYKRGIDFVALNFPNTEVGKSAQKLVLEAEKLKIAEAFMPEQGLSDFKLIYRIEKTNYQKLEQLKDQLEKAIEQEKYGFTVSVDVYNPQENLIVVHGLTSKLGSRGLGDFMANPSNGFNISDTAIPIATENYKIIQVYKSLDDYEKEML